MMKTITKPHLSSKVKIYMMKDCFMNTLVRLMCCGFLFLSHIGLGFSLGLAEAEAIRFESAAMRTDTSINNSYYLIAEKKKKQKQSAGYYIDDRFLSTELFYGSAMVTTVLPITGYGLLVGGLGHFMQGRIGKGVFFLLAPPAVIVLSMLAGSAFIPDPKHGMGALVGMGYGLMGVVALKVWEIIDIWVVPEYRNGGVSTQVVLSTNTW